MRRKLDIKVTSGSLSAINRVDGSESSKFEDTVCFDTSAHTNSKLVEHGMPF